MAYYVLQQPILVPDTSYYASNPDLTYYIPKPMRPYNQHSASTNAFHARRRIVKKLKRDLNEVDTKLLDLLDLFYEDLLNTQERDEAMDMLRKCSSWKQTLDVPDILKTDCYLTIFQPKICEFIDEAKGYAERMIANNVDYTARLREVFDSESSDV